MSLYQDWKDLLENQTDETLEAFWGEYSDAEMKIYTHLLKHKDEHLTGKLSELAGKFECRPVIFMGFLDGVETSLAEGCSLDLEALSEDSDVDVAVDYQKLYLNMWKADAPHLYTLEAWDNVIPQKEREKSGRDYKKSKVYHAPKKPGRNDPCPCGSGKKYKNCCGKN